MINSNVIKSVLGFNLKADIKDKEGNIIPSGSRLTYPGTFNGKVSYKMIDKSFFTSFNEELFHKIIIHRRIND